MTSESSEKALFKIVAELQTDIRELKDKQRFLEANWRKIERVDTECEDMQKQIIALTDMYKHLSMMVGGLQDHYLRLKNLESLPIGKPGQVFNLQSMKWEDIKSQSTPTICQKCGSTYSGACSKCYFKSFDKMLDGINEAIDEAE